MHGLFSMFNPCTTLFTLYKEHPVTTWTYTYCILEIACNKFSYKEKMCSRKKTPVIHLSLAPTSHKGPVNLHILRGHFWEVRLYYYQSYHHHQSLIINHRHHHHCHHHGICWDLGKLLSIGFCSWWFLVPIPTKFLGKERV